MATGFMTRHSILLLAFACALLCGRAAAADVALIGVIGDKAAVLAIDGGEPKTVKVGSSWRGVTVLTVEKDQATVEVDGEKRVLQRGLHYRNAEATASGTGKALVAADSRGHFFVDGAVNRVPVRFLVDTGATMVSLPQSDADRLGIDYRRGRRGASHTANGMATVYLVRLDSIRIGGIELYGVDAMVHEGPGLDQALLGMSFLNRVNIQRDGPTLTLIQRF
jgi:aspartyl protease family protein